MGYESLDHDTRTVALVGKFLQYWAMMENSINNAIGKALRLDDLQTLVVAKNVQFRDKIHILRTALTLTTLSPLDREKYDDLLNEIANQSHIRNMMAHDMFIPSKETNGVEFLVVKAKGKINFPDEDWPIEKFLTWQSKLYGWMLEIDKLRDAVDPARISALVDALIAHAQPRGGLFGLGAPIPESPHPQGILGPYLTDTNHEKEPETPEAPDASE